MLSFVYASHYHLGRILPLSEVVSIQYKKACLLKCHIRMCELDLVIGVQDDLM